MESLVSIIVPVYKAEKYLDQCVSSLVGQSYRNLEIILVDDGSPDSCPQMCDIWAQKDERIVVIHKKNAGVSQARNSGLSHAHGRYVVFVDADDKLDLDVIKLAVQKSSSEKAQLCIWNAALLINDIVKMEQDLYVNSMTNEQVFCTIISSYHGDYNLGKYVRAVWGKLLDADIIRSNNIKFSDKLYIGEDAVFLCEYLQHIEHISVMNYTGYYYRIIDTSAVRRYKPDLLKQSILQFERFQEIFKTEGELISPVLADSFTVLAWELFRNLVYNQSISNQSNSRNKNKNNDAKKWFKRQKEFMKVKGYKKNYIPKITKLQIMLSYILPISMQCKVALAYMKHQKNTK